MELTKDQEELFNALTPLQKAVCMHIFLGLRDIDAYMKERPAMDERTAAAAVSRMMKKKNVIAFIGTIRKIKPPTITTVVTKEDIQSAVASRQEILERLTQMMRGDVFSVMRVSRKKAKDKEGNELKDEFYNYPELLDPDEITEEAKRNVAKMSTSQGGLTVVMHDPIKAMQMLVKMQGYDIPEPTDDEALTPWANLKGCED